MTTPKTPPRSPANRRATPRFDIRLAAELSLPGGKSTAAVTRDLSVGGACVESAYPLVDGSEIGVALFVVVDGVEEASLPSLRVSATVQWTAQNDETAIEVRHIAGLKFAALSEAQSAWIKRFVPAR
ncbi:MAG TPA: PilZ domain-containing protein [Kofleriaceae bacterium]